VRLCAKIFTAMVAMVSHFAVLCVLISLQVLVSCSLASVQPAYELLDRLLPGSSNHFDLKIDNSCQSNASAACFTMRDASDGRIAIAGTSVSEITAACGVYLREWCNLTIGRRYFSCILVLHLISLLCLQICLFIFPLSFSFFSCAGWPRGGGSRLATPSPWPSLGPTVTRARIVPWSYIMNVCTHSYSLVWYSWQQWSDFIDWMALSGINMALALTGDILRMSLFISLFYRF
jgi:hypothetical protein